MAYGQNTPSCDPLIERLADFSVISLVKFNMFLKSNLTRKILIYVFCTSKI